MTVHEMTNFFPKARSVRLWCVALLSLWVGTSLFAPAFAQDARGKAEEVRDGAWVMREDKKIPLVPGMEVREFDIVKTDSTGSASIRFLDDSILELRANASVAIKEVVASEKRNRFDVDLVEGTARVVTGLIVKKNPRGFKVTTPKSTVGIRGTTLLVSVLPSEESVAVEKLSEGHEVEVSYRGTGIVKTLRAPNSSVSVTQAGSVTQVGDVGDGPTKGSADVPDSSGGSDRGERESRRESGGSDSASSPRPDPCRDGPISSPPGK